ncbi:MAG: hypothetical protein JNL84_08035 [Candidatus Accumulibacter sp.]|nr:hypothetical protein [Accumulibacter sp.]
MRLPKIFLSRPEIILETREEGKTKIRDDALFRGRSAKNGDQRSAEAQKRCDEQATAPRSATGQRPETQGMDSTVKTGSAQFAFDSPAACRTGRGEAKKSGQTKFFVVLKRIVCTFQWQAKEKNPLVPLT